MKAQKTGAMHMSDKAPKTILFSSSLVLLNSHKMNVPFSIEAFIILDYVISHEVTKQQRAFRSNGLRYAKRSLMS